MSSTTAPSDRAATPVPAADVGTATGRPPAEGWAERLARRILFVEGREVEALVPLRGSLVLSAVRCIIAYVVVPVAAPMVSWLGALATPVSLVLSVAAVALSVRSLRRVWLAQWRQRWAYTAFILVVIAVLLALIAWDVRLLAT